MNPKPVTVRLIRFGEVLEAEAVQHPNLEAVENIVRALISEAARKTIGPLWPFRVEVK